MGNTIGNNFNEWLKQQYSQAKNDSIVSPSLFNLFGNAQPSVISQIPNGLIQSLFEINNYDHTGGKLYGSINPSTIDSKKLEEAIRKILEHRNNNNEFEVDYPNQILPLPYFPDEHKPIILPNPIDWEDIPEFPQKPSKPIDIIPQKPIPILPSVPPSDVGINDVDGRRHRPTSPARPHPPIDNNVPVAPSKPRKPKMDMRQLEKIERESSNIADQIKDAIVDELSFNGARKKVSGNASNQQTLKALSKISADNVAFVLLKYKQKAGEDLAHAIDGERGLDINYVKKYICNPLVMKAKSLNIKVYFDDFQTINDIDNLSTWIEDLASNVRQAMRDQAMGKNIATDYNAPTPSKPKTSSKTGSSKRMSSATLESMKKSGHKLALDLSNAIEDKISVRGLVDKVTKNRNNEKTLAVLKSIKANSVAFMVEDYKKITGEDIVHAIDNEVGLDINTVKRYVCKQLVFQAKAIGLTNIYHGSYMNIKDIDELAKWVEDVSSKIRAQMADMIKEKDYDSVTKNDGNRTEHIITNRPVFEQAGISKIVEIRDNKSNVLESTTYFNDGKVVLEYYASRTDGSKVRVRKVLQEGSQPKQQIMAPPKEMITEPVPIDIKLPDDANENARKFARSLQKNKSFIMRTLGIDNDTYNKLARLAMAIAEQETNFGDPNGTIRNGKYNGFEVINDTIVGQATEIAKGSAISSGFTQIKYNDHIKDPDVKAMFEKLGIHSASDLYEASNSAVGTVGLLFILMGRIKRNKNVANGVDAAKDAIVEKEGFQKTKDGVEKTYETKPWVNEITDEDLLCYYWNGKVKDILNGTMQPDANPYTRNVKQYLKKYQVIEDPQARKIAKQKALDAANTPSNNRNIGIPQASAQPYKNNGAIGSIIFMPKMYSQKPVNTKEDIDLLRSGLDHNSSVNAKPKQLLIWAVENGLIAFEYGIDASEVAALTQKDVDLLLKKIDVLKQKIKEVNFNDGINNNESLTLANKYMELIRQAEIDFQKEYLTSHAAVYNTNDLPASAVVTHPNTNSKMDVARLVRRDKKRRGFVGYHDDKGVNGSNTSDESKLLATSAKNVANSKRTSGRCLEGVRQALYDAGIKEAKSKDPKDGLVEGTPRGAVKWFERHPEMFEEVKFMNIGNGKSREITSSDLPSLPAGYIVIFIPENDYAQEPGHICITNGNGEAYADETDNLNWSSYTDETKKSGKGEHGTFRIFRLTDKWDIKNGKLVFNG